MAEVSADIVLCHVISYSGNSGITISLRKPKKDVSPARKYQQPRHQEDQGENDEERVTRPPPAGVVKHLSGLPEDKETCYQSQ